MGTYVRIVLPDVPMAAAEHVCRRVSAYLLGQAPPLSAFALHKHESKLSVVHMAVHRAAGYEAPIANKEEVTIVTGCRVFSARPILSSDEYNMDKFKMERFMHAGRGYMLSAYAPISFPPQPVLVLKTVRCSLLRSLLVAPPIVCFSPVSLPPNALLRLCVMMSSEVVQLVALRVHSVLSIVAGLSRLHCETRT